jgi:hypothetical protein
MEVPVELMPPVDPGVAIEILNEVDQLVNYQRDATKKFEKSGIHLARRIGKISENAYWTFRGYMSEGDYVRKTFPQSDSQYYILRRVGIALKSYPMDLLEEIGISKCQDLVRIHNFTNGIIDPNWFVLAKTLKRDEFRKKVSVSLGKCLPAPSVEDGIIIHFKVWNDSIPVHNRAMEIAALLAGTNKSPSHLYNNIILPEFLSGYNEEGSALINENNFNLTLIRRAIKNLNEEGDPSVWDRLIGE